MPEADDQHNEHEKEMLERQENLDKLYAQSRSLKEGMSVVQLRDFLNRCIDNGLSENRVTIDTEAATFTCHLVDVQAASVMLDWGQGDMVTLHPEYRNGEMLHVPDQALTETDIDGIIELLDDCILVKTTHRGGEECGEDEPYINKDRAKKLIKEFLELP